MKQQFLIKTLIISLCFCCGINLFAQQTNPIDSLYPDAALKIRYHNAWTSKEYPRRIKQFKEQPLQPGEIVFLGNSITQMGRDWSEKFNTTGIRNRGIAGDVTDGVLARLDEIIYFKPKAVFILIGINDLFNFHKNEGIPSATYVGKNIVKIARTIKRESPNTAVYVQTVLPTKYDYLQTHITEVNQLLKASKQYYNLIDLHQQFANDADFIKDELTNDGTHLTPKGYSVWVETLSPIIQNLKAND